jgi:hypothetical protein
MYFLNKWGIDDFVSLLCFLTTFQDIFSSFMAFSVLNKEEIASLQRLLETQKIKEKEKNHQQLAQWHRKVAPWRKALRSLRSGARIWRHGAGA